MSQELQNAIAQQVLDSAHDFRVNAAWKGGVPLSPQRNIIPPPFQYQPAQKPPTEEKKDSLLSKIGAWVGIPLLAAALGTGGAYVGTNAAKDIQSTGGVPPAIEKPGEAQGNGDILQWLDQKGG